MSIFPGAYGYPNIALGNDTDSVTPRSFYICEVYFCYPLFLQSLPASIFLSLIQSLHASVGQDLSLGKRMPLSPPNKTSSTPLPTDEQQRTNGHAVAPAIAGRASPKPSAAPSRIISCQLHYWHSYWFLLFQLLSAFY